MEIEQQARSDGWVPQGEWGGDPGKWVTAEKFVERGEAILPIVKADRDKAKAESLELRKELAEVKKTTQEFKDFQDTVLENTKKKLGQQIDDLKAEKKLAAKDNDLEAVVTIDDKIEELETAIKAPEPKPEPVKNQPAEMSPEDTALYNSWLGENDWYKDNKRLRFYADNYAQTLQGKLQGNEFLDELTREVKDAFPNEFQNPNRKRASNVDGGSPKGGNGKGRGFDDLPADCQDACSRFVKNIKGFTVERYLQEYDWDE
tara:strand:- start:619 stop:1398 length:780 start_codon:yes stop_codon:yes gene_type:complete